MHYYLVSLSRVNSEAFTYQSEEQISLYRKVVVSFQNREKEGYVIKEVEKPSFKCLGIKEIKNEFLTQKQFDLASFISSYYFAALSLSLDLFTPFKDDKEIEPITVETSVELSKKQQNSFSYLKEHPAALLFGDTGSGKTEIYIKAIEEALNRNKTAVFLMPEISLTPQMEKRLKAHFKDLIAIWHSKVTKKRKEKILEDLSSGKLRVMAGARSALFLPLKNLGLIIVDEEHDESYKSATTPRYNTRDLAVLFGDRLNAQVILGSATPSMTTYSKFPKTRLKGQYFEGSKEFFFKKPPAETLDMETLNTLKETYKNGKQSIVFVPTRANFKYLVCQECGKTEECPYCSVAMSIHTYKKIIKCHYCGYTAPIPSKCSYCGSDRLESNRTGTAEVVRFLEKEIEGNIVQFDRDTVTTETKLKKTLSAFNKNEIDILVGTQMLSKGHNYHNVDTAVILGLDYMLANSDYKADEKALSMLYQISGRAGRAGKAKIMVITNNEDFFKGYLEDYEEFIKENIEFRQGLYPPYTKMAKILFENPDTKKIEASVGESLETLKKFQPLVEVVGHGECPIHKINKNFRSQIIIRSKTSKELLQALANLANPLCKIDVDPISFS